MGRHKHNPTAIAAKNGELSPKKQPKLSKRQVDALMRRRVQNLTGIPTLQKVMGIDPFYIKKGVKNYG